MKRKPPVLDKPVVRHRAISPEEKELWQATLQKSGRQTIDKPKIAKSLKAEKSKSKDVTKVVHRNTSNLQPHSSLDNPTLTRIRRGATAIEATLDLHGHTQETAYDALLHFIMQLQSRNIRIALIITGKGSGGKEGTLRKMLPRWLNESPLRERIIAYDSAGLRHGGSGAWYIRIRKRDNNGRS